MRRAFPRVVLAATVVAALAACGSDNRANPSQVAALGEDLPEAVAAYAPVVRLHPRERFFPASAEDFLSHSRLVFFDSAGRADLVADAPEAALLGDGGYRYGGFTSSDLTRPYHERAPGRQLGQKEGFALDLADDQRCTTAGCSFVSAPAYYQYVPHRYVTYWFFYGYSAPISVTGNPSYRFGHEGDWERISVLLDNHDRATAVAYYQHESQPQLVPWRDAQKRPVVYSALGTHASYPGPGAKNVTLGYVGVPNGRPAPSATFSDTRATGAEWQTRFDLRDVRGDWFGYGGAWGNRGRFTFTTGPLGPSGWKAPAPCIARISPPCTPTAQSNATTSFLSS